MVTKIPRFAFEKFPLADSRLTTQMKSVGEVMAIGRTFQESFQKALRGLETGIDGMDERSTDRDEIATELGEPGPERVLYVGDALRVGMTVEEIHEESGIDPWFLAQVEEIVATERKLAGRRLDDLSKQELRWLKAGGFSDRRLARLLATNPDAVRARRWALGVRPVFKRVDTCAAEFSTDTAYMYSTYEDADEDEAQPTGRRKVMVLGGGPNRIGQGIEFDYCCVHAAFALRDDGYETIMVNCNPETVSTDYDTSDRLYFEPLTLEDVLEIVAIEKPFGVIVQYGGQTPLKLALALEANGVPIIGTSPESIDIAEDRERFQKLLQDLGLKQPPNRTARTEAQALELAGEIGYPLVVRPSYVLGGRAMEIVHEQKDLERYMREAVKVSEDSPVLLDRFLNDAIEVDVDCLSDGSEVFIGGVMEHIEQAGVHSGDSACSLPPHSLSPALVSEMKRQSALMARALKVCGLMNVQFAIQRDAGDAGEAGAVAQVDGDGTVYVLEVNPRASRTVPYVSKATGLQLAKIAARCMVGPQPGRPGRDPRSRAEVFLGQGGGVPVRQVPGRRHDPRPRDEVDRRGDGRRPHVRRGLRQVATRRRRALARVGDGVHLGEERRQAEGGGNRAHAARDGFHAGGHQGHRGGDRGRRRPGHAGQQGAGGAPARGRPAEERRGLAGAELGRGKARRDRRFALDSHHRAGAARDLLHDDRRRAGGGRGHALAGAVRRLFAAGVARRARLNRRALAQRFALELR